jgi:hypothetical protein
MLVSKSFIQDFAYLANRYGWTPADVEEMKAAIRQNEPAGKHYITVLAGAHRDGYVQTPENGHIRLEAWYAQQGIAVFQPTCSI